jgi:hypothetical protein
MTVLRLVLSEPLSESGRFITWELSPLINAKNQFHDRFDCGISQGPIDHGGEKGSKPAVKIDMAEEPIPKRPSSLI